MKSNNTIKTSLIIIFLSASILLMKHKFILFIFYIWFTVSESVSKVVDSIQSISSLHTPSSSQITGILEGRQSREIIQVPWNRECSWYLHYCHSQYMYLYTNKYFQTIHALHKWNSFWTNKQKQCRIYPLISLLPKLNVLLYWHWKNTILLGAVSVIGLVHVVKLFEVDIR